MAEVTARIHAGGSLKVFKAVEDLRCREDIRRRTLSAVDTQFPLSAVPEGDRHFLPVDDCPLDDGPASPRPRT